MKKTLLFGCVLCALSVAASGAVAAAAATVRQEAGASSVYYRDGTRYALQGRLEEAANAFEQAAVLDPRNANIYYNLGNVYSEQGRWADAVAAYRKAVSLKRNDVEAYNGLGVALSQRGAYEQAAAAFERAIDIYPKWAEPHFHLSHVRRALRQETEARAAYEQALRLRPDYAARPPRTFLTTAARAGDAARSEKVAAANVAAGEGRNPVGEAPARLPAPPAPARVSTPTPSAPTRVATPPATTPPAAVERPRDDEAPRVAASEAGRLSSGDAAAYYDSGVRHGRAGRHEEAVKSFRQSIMLNRDHAGAYLALGDSYAALGRWRESVDAYEQAARLNPDDAETYRRLGKSYAKLRETTPARAAGDDASADAARASAPPRNAAGASGPPERVTPDRGRAPLASGVDPTSVYLVGPGDVLDVRLVGGTGTGTTSYKVTPTGLLDHPSLAEPLRVEGMTTAQVAARLAAGLKRQAAGPEPEVVVGVREYASHAIIVSGMVKEPGTKILQREGVPLYVIIAHAQPLPSAGQALVRSHATGQNAAVDLSDVGAMNMLVRPGDVITVRPRPEQYFYIAGAVREPGQKKFAAGLTLTQAVLAAGGAAPQAAGRVRIARQKADGRLDTATYDLREIGAGRSPDPLVEPGDRIEVLR